MSTGVLRRILIRANDDSAGPNTLFLFDEALRAERRATVERIRAALKGRGFSPISEADMEWIGWRLDEEAARE